MNSIRIEGGRTLIDGALHDTPIEIADGVVAAHGSTAPTSSATVDARGLLVLPGIVDIHGDAFERQVMPRPGVGFPLDIALVESDCQAIANGMTTVFHATTWSWEPGLRGTDTTTRLLQAIETMRPRLAADTRFHLRHETYNLDAEETIAAWMAAGRIDLLAFNDHMELTAADSGKPHKRTQMVERTGLTGPEFDRLVTRVIERGPDVPASLQRLASAARGAGVRMLSHDDSSPAQRQAFRAMGAGIAEFPVNEETAREAARGGDAIVFGAPNVVRGGSHTGWTRAADMIAKGLCSVLASDYYYPAPLLAAFRLVADDVLSLPDAWALISSSPARAAGLADRGLLACGQRADIVLVDDRAAHRPRVVAVFVAGRLVYLTEAQRLRGVRDTHDVTFAA